MSVSDLTISKLGPQADGIHEGKRGRVFVERTLPGDRVKARVRVDHKGIARGELIALVEPSSFRQAPPCPNYEACGNCSLQHANESFYRDWKIALVKDAFRRQGVHPLKWLDPVFLGGNNRRRATFSAIKWKRGLVVGYYRRRSREIVDIETCLVAEPKLLALREALKPELEKILADGKPVDVFVQHVDGGFDVLLTGSVGRSGRPDEKVRSTLSSLTESTSVRRVAWRSDYDEAIKVLAARSAVTTRFGALSLELPPAAFLQPTLEGERALVGAVLNALPSDNAKPYADLFSGCGTFTGALLERGRVDAYEAVPSAVKALAKAGEGQENLRVFRRDLYRNPLGSTELDRYQAVVFDPPRGGCPEQASALAKAKCGVLVGVSCNPATFARDARLLGEGGYRLQSVQVVDQFLWSHHVEVVGVFARKKRLRR